MITADDLERQIRENKRDLDLGIITHDAYVSSNRHVMAVAGDLGYVTRPRSDQINYRPHKDIDDWDKTLRSYRIRHFLAAIRTSYFKR